MNIDDSFYKRIAIARTSLGITQGKLADMVGIGRRQVASYEGGNSKPRDGVLQNLAAALGTSAEWLATGNGEGPDTSNVKRTITLREIPVYNNLKAIEIGNGEWTIDGSVCDYIAAPLNAKEHSFAFRIQGDSMESPVGISFPQGTIVTFDPNAIPKDGDFVLCSDSQGENATFKQLIIDQNTNYLKPLNHLYPMVVADRGLKLLGVAIHSQIDLMSAKENGYRYIQDLWGNPALDSQGGIDHTLSERISAIEDRLDDIMHLLKK
ncbi:TPA: LexA family protein [Klebsiella oxytoca]|nr:helix-turn-helix domain-containing protein [Klebsiella oxytoca]